MRYPVELTAAQIKELNLITSLDLPTVTMRTTTMAPFVGGFHFLRILDEDGEKEDFYECYGYAKRLLFTRNGEIYVVHNTISPMLWGVFQSKQDVTNKGSSHPLIKDAVGKSLWEARPGQCWRCGEFTNDRERASEE